MTTTAITDYHPFAFASDRGLGFGAALREPLDPQRRSLVAGRSAD